MLKRDERTINVRLEWIILIRQAVSRGDFTCLNILQYWHYVPLGFLRNEFAPWNREYSTNNHLRLE